MAAILQASFLSAFYWPKCILIQTLLTFVPGDPIDKKKVNIGLGNGLALNR